MSRYIDADALAKKLTYWSTGTVEPIDWSDIAVAPSIDIVRCGECRYWHNGECWGIPYRGDYDTSIDTKADDFCSYGESECWGIPYRGDYDTSIDTKADDFCSYGEREDD